jgi:hypothetical protein
MVFISLIHEHVAFNFVFHTAYSNVCEVIEAFFKFSLTAVTFSCILLSYFTVTATAANPNGRGTIIIAAIDAPAHISKHFDSSYIFKFALPLHILLPTSSHDDLNSASVQSSANANEFD